MYFAKELLTLKFIIGARCSPGTPETCWTSSDGFPTDEFCDLLDFQVLAHDLNVNIIVISVHKRHG